MSLSRFHALFSTEVPASPASDQVSISTSVSIPTSTSRTCKRCGRSSVPQSAWCVATRSHVMVCKNCDSRI